MGRDPPLTVGVVVVAPPPNRRANTSCRRNSLAVAAAVGPKSSIQRTNVWPASPAVAVLSVTLAFTVVVEFAAAKVAFRPMVVFRPGVVLGQVLVPFVLRPAVAVALPDSLSLPVVKVGKVGGIGLVVAAGPVVKVGLVVLVGIVAAEVVFVFVLVVLRNTVVALALTLSTVPEVVLGAWDPCLGALGLESHCTSCK